MSTKAYTFKGNQRKLAREQRHAKEITGAATFKENHGNKHGIRNIQRKSDHNKGYVKK